MLPETGGSFDSRTRVPKMTTTTMSNALKNLNADPLASVENLLASPLTSARNSSGERSNQTLGEGMNTHFDQQLILNYLSFLEQKIGNLRSIIASNGSQQQQQQLLSAELNCITVQLISISRTLSPSIQTEPLSPETVVSLVKETKSPVSVVHHNNELSVTEEHDLEGDNLLPGTYEVTQIEEEEILAPHTHFCTICGKGFKRDANLRMHMRGHGDEYKTIAALSKHVNYSETLAVRRYSCPFPGCKRNKLHKNFQPLKTPICVKNHYKRSHCNKSYICSKCHVKKFSVVADLRTHEKHCGSDRWVCSCGTSFSRKDKLFGHVAVFEGHTPVLPFEECMEGHTPALPSEGCLEMLNEVNPPLVQIQAADIGDVPLHGLEFTENEFGEEKDIAVADYDDSCGYCSPMGLDSCSFDGFYLLDAPPGMGM